uniref:Uncharacterized protein n=1 Tax=Pavo cristatus TaxID=9049 RepID=A0A8C9L8E5_PAVCR
MDPAEAVLQEKALKFMVRGRGERRGHLLVLSLQCSMPRSLWLGCSSLADSMPSLRCLYNPGTGALPAFQVLSVSPLSFSLPAALLDSGRCPASPPLLKQAFSRAFCGGGGRRLFY